MLVRTPFVALFTDEPIDGFTEILYVNYEQLENTQRLSRLCKWLGSGSGMLVIDEAHRIKGGGGSIRWRACYELANQSIDLIEKAKKIQVNDEILCVESLAYTAKMSVSPYTRWLRYEQKIKSPLVA